MIIEVLSPRLTTLLENIENLGFSLCLIGGFTRDFFHTGILGNDLDFEIRASQKRDDVEGGWPFFYKKLHSFLLEKKIPYTELPYLVTRVFFEGVHLEFSSPRVEKNITDNHSHHHFEAILNPFLAYDISFKRRDFTINAIGVEFSFRNKMEQVIDPYEGLKDLKNGVLKNISEDFFFDSVRFLRFIRFKLKFNQFHVDRKLFDDLGKFNLTHLSAYHFKEELFKSRPGAFLNQFQQLVLLKSMTLPREFILWTKYQFPEDLTAEEEILAFVYLQNPDDAKDVAHFFSMPAKTLKSLKTFVASFESIKDLTKMDFINLLSLSEEEALQNSILKNLKNLEEKKEWCPILLPKLLSDKLLVSWNDWRDSKVSLDELIHVHPKNRSYYQFYKTIKNKFCHD